MQSAAETVKHTSVLGEENVITTQHKSREII